jgi:hypothetical protein
MGRVLHTRVAAVATDVRVYSYRVRCSILILTTMGKQVQCCGEGNAVPTGPGALQAGSRYSTRVGAVVVDARVYSYRVMCSI